MAKAGIYIHIPFCRKACHYCNFHFSTQMKYKEEMIKCILKEIELKSSHFQQYEIQTIYFGGGTPSILNESELKQIIGKVYELFEVDKKIELTLEANPDDLDLSTLQGLHKAGVNRLSIGIQSFFDKHLSWMNRSHTTQQALSSIHLARQVGIEELNADLIFAIPGMGHDQWVSNIQQFIDLDLTHWSCYNLTIEPKTALHYQVRKNKIHPVEENEAARQYQTLLQMAASAGMEHYEISNFCKPGKYAIHNSNYWRGFPYLGIGPSAHSYDGTTRTWNIANNALYMKAIQHGNSFSSEEQLTPAMQYNEYVMTGLRTMWGCEIGKIQSFGNRFLEQFRAEIQTFISSGWVAFDDETYRLTNTGKLFADHIASELFWVE
jgi:oxygen-independent coproporphyrinogen-3 oxidase